MTPSPCFALLGEPLALDLINTRVHRVGQEVDLLDTVSALSAWLHAERTRLRWQGRPAHNDLMAVRELRATLAALVQAARTRQTAPAAPLRHLNMLANAPAAQPRLLWSGHGPRLAPPTAAQRLPMLLADLARDAMTLLASPRVQALRECAHPDCVVQFVADNPRRRWCQAATCGNRARVARHYQRVRTQR